MKMLLLAASIAVVFFYSSPSPADGSAASKLFADGNFDAAATAYAAVLASTPNDTAAAIQLGAIRLYQNDLADAEQLLTLARSGPDKARATRLLSELNRRRAELARRSTVEGLESDVPFVKSDPLPVVRAAVNGKMGTFVVDTGGTISLEPAFAAKAGIRGKAGGEGMFAGGKRAP
ncbi:MAG TPA: tetratricopeptide repeat protein, partial [Candidatus Acidoferrum sp.]|nr:tetratricopeptide repeat protein [Candidatus Acidoferrum sp.]